MTPAQRPSHQQVRDWLKREVAAKRPPRTPEEIRTELGWKLVQENNTKR